jgi:hypothetical protein
MTATLARALSLALIATFVALAADAAQCVLVEDDKDAPTVVRPEVDVRQVIRLTPEGISLLQGVRLAYVKIVREEREAPRNGDRILSPEEIFVRLLDGPRRETTFTFSREGTHTLRVFGSSAFAWPAPASTGEPVSGCEDLSVTVDDAKRRPDFPGVRGQWWAAYRVPTNFQLGGSVFVKRLGFAAATEVNVSRTIGDPDDPSNVNPVIGVFELRWRGARGYLGGGVRYYPDDEPNRDHFRFAAVAAEELPSFKGRPIWLLVGLRLEEPDEWIKGLRLEFGMRFDLWGTQP